MTDDRAGQRRALRRFFRRLNRAVMLPVLRLDLAPLLANPLTGYLAILTTTGRRSGLPRATPVNYAILDGRVYCVAGWGRTTHWFANLLQNPRVELRMPGMTLSGLAEEVTDRQEARRAIVAVARNAGIGLAFDGLNPLTASDAAILTRNGWMPVVRIRLMGIAGGPYDPGGKGWLAPALALVAWLIRRVARSRRRG